MGSDRKSKNKRSPAESSSEDERKNKKRKTSEPKTDRKHKSRKESTSKDGKPEEKHKHKHKHHKHDCREISNFKELSDADYFSKNIEFATWLKDSKDIFFSDLTSESARKLFAKFVEKWNKKKLDSKYYDGILTAPRSSHNWKIKAEPKAAPQRYGEYDQV